MKNSINLAVSVFIFGIGVLCLFNGCKTPQLEQGGAYNIATTNAAGQVTSSPDFAFFAVDSAFDLAYKTVDGIFLYEQQNRAALWAISPNIKHSLDKARPVAADIVRRYTAARAVYKSSPTVTNLTTLQGILSEIETLSATIQAASTKPTP